MLCFLGGRVEGANCFVAIEFYGRNKWKKVNLLISVTVNLSGKYLFSFNAPKYLHAPLNKASRFSSDIFERTYTYKNFQMFKLVLEKAEEPEIKLPTSAGSWKKQESSRKTSISALLTMPKPLTVWITINCGKFWKRWEYQTTWPASWETYLQIRKQQLELDMEQQTVSK